MLEATQKQQKILDFILFRQREKGSPPTYQEIADEFGFCSLNSVTEHLRLLRDKGLVDFERRKARSLRINSPLVKLRVQVVDVPLFGSIPAGFASSREQAAEGCISIDINSIGFKPTAYTFALRVKGDSMIGRHIVSGDIAIFDQAQEPLHGDIVAALVDGQSTLKTYFLRDGKPFLKAENPNYPDQAPAEELVIQGVLKAIIRGA